MAVSTSESLLSEYATLDDDHYLQIERLIQQIKLYLIDKSRKRPLNILMLASPGAGKSHFIKQLAKSMRDHSVRAVTFNMATMQSADDMAQPIDNLRNLKVDDQFPLLFLDEFDSDPARYAALLPLLWDGELQIGHRDLKLGKAVVVLAGSNPELPKTMAHSGTMRLDGGAVGEFQPTGKLVDLLSHINGGIIEIPDLDLQTESRDRRIDKVCIAVSLLKARFGSDLSGIPRSLLRFIAHTNFRYGVRSIAHPIDIIDPGEILADASSPRRKFSNKALSFNLNHLPMSSERSLQDSSLRLHLLDKDRGFGIVNRWKEYAADDTVVSLEDETRFILPYLRLPVSKQ